MTPAKLSDESLELTRRIAACLADDDLIFPGTTNDMLRARCLPEKREELERLLSGNL